MSRKFGFASAAILALLQPGYAVAAVITFETAPLGESSQLTTGVTEAGFIYSKSSGTPKIEQKGNPGKNLTTRSPIDACTVIGQSGGNNVGLVDFKSVSGERFTFSGLDYALGSNSTATGMVGLNVIGQLQGVTVGSAEFTTSGSDFSAPIWTSFGAGSLAGIIIDTLLIRVADNAAQSVCLGSPGNLTGQGYRQLVDNVRLDAVVDATVPLPAAWPLMAAGLGLINVAKRRKRARSEHSQ